MAQWSFTVGLPDAEATQQLGFRLGQCCPLGTVLLLSGNLGSGKTTLVQGLGAGLGIEEPISSPTFTLINEYLAGRVPLYHVDLYRLTPEQAESLELASYWEGSEVTPGIVAIEWAERLIDPPPEAIAISLGDGEKGGREAVLRAEGEALVAVLKEGLGHGLLVDEI
ncbi:tRNA (adenosine(37)-N6)-threonylcarbamoyltransferase complex ATPase subunit type 1 TsaE [Nodosilinea sp. LEGE 07088]|uniref:tRNA (adenosine(37)-N6)-threonylcarbamoyltransferase complex ATPase subunit type 1 TsaE n=1 Tax=Nodosilinea sp. LEGE 07088 TaxID=2777968 RepID=UPI0018818698|nr:tRNA (adenosine(37)-N6)-threonylcarbamoyltransferase complex ATPase subunit type 1 TsaE [Nodosilinea sp. LEGE 07088]MBE9136632.1 tRNA (adenosine(37)-N6)-threonylcarbamoyltransferase complex ATPase subunit type 1 TsaE [Nodosilinea sp. LEGE 07088]